MWTGHKSWHNMLRHELPTTVLYWTALRGIWLPWWLVTNLGCPNCDCRNGLEQSTVWGKLHPYLSQNTVLWKQPGSLAYKSKSAETVFDNPYKTDDSRSMGIMLSDTYCLLFNSHGSTIYFTSWFPTDEEFETFPHVIFTSDQPWDPHNLVMPGGDLAECDTKEDRSLQQVWSNVILGHNRHHKMFETDSVLHSIDRLTEQTLSKHMMSNVHVIEIPRCVHELRSTSRHSVFSPEHVASIFNCGIGTAKDILAATTQKGIRHSVMPLNQQYWVDHIHLNLKYLARLWTMDHMESKYISIRQHAVAIVFTNGKLVMVYPTKMKNDVDSTDSLWRFTEDFGIPAKLKSDMAAAFVGQHAMFQVLIWKLGINMTFAEPYRHNQIQTADIAFETSNEAGKAKWESATFLDTFGVLA